MALLPAALPRQKLSALGQIREALHELRRAGNPWLDDRAHRGCKLL